jgi:ribose transport system ATP-binding protein
MEAHDLLCSMSMNVDTHALITEISTAQQQMVEVAKGDETQVADSYSGRTHLSLTEREIEQLFTTIRELKTKGSALFIFPTECRSCVEIGDRVLFSRWRVCGLHGI